MTIDDVKEKEELEAINKEKKTRKSFIPPELSLYHEKRKKKNNQPLVKSSLGFPSEEYRLMTTNLYKRLGFTTLKSFVMSLIDMTNENEEVQKELRKKSIELKKR